MKLKELHAMSVEDLRAKEKSLRRELFELNYHRKIGRVDKPARFKNVHRDIARILTILTERAQDGKQR